MHIIRSIKVIYTKTRNHQLILFNHTKTIHQVCCKCVNYVNVGDKRVTLSRKMLNKVKINQKNKVHIKSFYNPIYDMFNKKVSLSDIDIACNN